MSVVYDVAYLLALALTAPWLIYGAIRHGKYREGYGEKLFGRVPVRSGSRPCAWFHAVSVGEVNLLRTLLDRFSASFPGWDCVISTTTKTGFDLARKKYAGHTVFYCPLDFSWAVHSALGRIRPDLLILAELEMWPNLIRLAKRRGCRIAIINGRLSAPSFRGYRRLRWLFSPVLSNVDRIAAQNAEYADRFRQLASDLDGTRIRVTGSVKFDGTSTDRNQVATQRLRELAGISAEEVVFLAGSTQEPEEELALATFRDCQADNPRLRLLIAPRHVTRCHDIARLLDNSGMKWQRRTALDTHGVDPQARILLIDTIGELAAWWGVAHIAFVGGSLGSRGGQNMIEPAGYGAAISFGPNTSNFRDIVRMLLDCNGAVVVADGSELTAFVRHCLEHPDWAQSLGQRAQDLVVSQQGASDKTLEVLRELVDDPVANAPSKAA